MNNTVPKVFFDSSAFIAFFQNESTRAETVLKILEDAKNRRIQLITSYAVVAECPMAAMPNGSIASGKDQIDEFFDQPFITKINIERLVATKSRFIQRCSKAMNQSGGQLRKPLLKPMDASHLASAIIQKADYLFTYDDSHLIKYDGHTLAEGVTICEPCRPWDVQMTINDVLGVSVEEVQNRTRAMGLS